MTASPLRLVVIMTAGSLLLLAGLSHFQSATRTKPACVVGVEPGPFFERRNDQAFGLHVADRAAEAGSLRAVQDRHELPSWAIPAGSEFWRRPKPASSKEASVSGPLKPSSGAVSDAIERVTHAFQADPQGTGLIVRGAGYKAGLDADGLSLTALIPARSPSPQGDGARFRTREMRLGAKRLYDFGGQGEAWAVLGNTAQRSLDPDTGIVEHYEAVEAGIEVTWVLAKPVQGEGDLIIDCELAGLEFAQETSSGMHFADASGLACWKVGNAVAVDQRGDRWQLPMEMTGDLLRVRVTPDLMRQASFPLAIDPLISPEFGVDQPLDAASSPSTRAAPSVAANDEGFLVVWTHGKGDATGYAVVAARMTPAGVLLDPYGIIISQWAAEQTTCSTAALPGGFLVAWSAPHGSSVSDWDIFGARVRPTGVVEDTTPLTICGVSGSVQCSPAVAANGANYFVVWRDNRQTGIYGALVSLQGQVSPADGFPVCTAANEQLTPAVGSLGPDFLVAWQDYRKATTSQFYSDIYAARVTGAGTVMDTNGIAVCTMTNSQFHPAVSADGTNYLVVWEDYDIGGNDIRGARVTPGGTVIDTAPMVISHAANAQANPVVTSYENGFVVGWQDYRTSATNTFAAQVCVARVSGSGELLDADGRRLSDSSSGQSSPALARSNGEFMAAWQDSRNNPATMLSDVFGSHFAFSQFESRTEASISGSANGQVNPAVAASGPEFLAVWADARNSATNGLDIYGVRLDREGGILGNGAFVISGETNHQSDPVIAGNDAGYLVVWSDWRNGTFTTAQPDIYGTIISRAGVVRQPAGVSICTQTNDQMLPAVAWQGANFLVVWQDGRASSGTTARWDIYGSRISSEGAVLDPAGLAICTQAANQTQPGLAANGADALVVFTDARGGATTSDIYGVRVGSDGAVSGTNGFAICTASSAQFAPAVAGNGTNYLVAWADSRNGSANAPDIYGVWVAADGSAYPTNGFGIRVAPGQQTLPTVVSVGAQYFVSWQEATNVLYGYDIAGRLIGPDLASGATPKFQLSSGAESQITPVMSTDSASDVVLLYQGWQRSANRVLGRMVNLRAIPQMGQPALRPDGGFEAVLSGAPGERYAVEASEDLLTWKTLGTFTNENGALRFGDAGITNLPARFYRALLIP